MNGQVDHIARASTTISAPPSQVWNALTTPSSIKQYMFGSDVSSSWEVGSPITWKGSWEGKRYEDKGVILKFDPDRTLQYSHFSPRSGQPDLPENYHTVTIRLAELGNSTRVTLTQDNNATQDAREHSEKNWNNMLSALKEFLER